MVTLLKMSSSDLNSSHTFKTQALEIAYNFRLALSVAKGMVKDITKSNLYAIGAIHSNNEEFISH